MADIEVEAFTIERSTTKIDRAVYAQARVDERLDRELDAHLSNMNGETLIIDPELGPINPYHGNRSVDLMALLRPILAHVPAWQVTQYALERGAEGDES